jgi:hypothetical protein
MLFLNFKAKKWWCFKLISWKQSFNRLKEEYEVAKKKKQALDNLLNSGRISPTTHEMFNREIDETISEIERQQKTLLEKMKTKMVELEKHIHMLEMLYANFEIQHVTGEIEEEVYQRETGLLSAGLETARQELEDVREAVNQLSAGIQIPSPDVNVEQEVETISPENVEIPTLEAETLEPQAQVVEINTAESPEMANEQPQEILSGAEQEQQPTQAMNEEEQQEV